MSQFLDGKVKQMEGMREMSKMINLMSHAGMTNEPSMALADKLNEVITQVNANTQTINEFFKDVQPQMNIVEDNANNVDEESEVEKWKDRYKRQTLAYIELMEKPKAEPVRHGHWVVINPNTAKCSECGHLRATAGRDMTGQGLIHKAVCRYCESCGAKMDAERREG